ncbi:hypothetical protein ACH9L7_19080 (plasmid) [Haloferax sp. S1W]|uniref:hypothetical protein n=1 Tax=Haloferax sp. S1W TaxID=3377110 RepID=UPI0037C74EB7
MLGDMNKMYTVQFLNAMVGRLVTSRRTALKTITGSLLGAGTFSSVGSAASGRLDRVQVSYGSLTSPITASERATLTSQAKEAFKQDVGQYPEAAGSVADAPKPNCVGYAVGFDNRGTPTYMSVRAADQESVSDRHAELEGRVEHLRAGISSSTISQTYPSPQASQNWDPATTIYASAGAQNSAGTVDHEIEFFHLENDGVSDGETFATIQRITSSPETYKHSSVNLEQDYSPATNSVGVQSNALTDYATSSTVSGSGTKSAEISARGTPKSFSWTHNDSKTSTESRTDSEDSDNLFAEFVLLPGDGNTKENSAAASAVETDEPSEGVYDVVTASITGNFFFDISSETLTDSHTIDVDYGLL